MENRPQSVRCKYRESSRRKTGTIDMKKTGEKLRDRMDAEGLSVRYLAHLLGFSHPQAVYRWLRGEALPTVDHFYALSRLFGCRIDDLIAGNEEENDNALLLGLHNV